jgi:hypothetical protein
LWGSNRQFVPARLLEQALLVEDHLLCPYPYLNRFVELDTRNRNNALYRHQQQSNYRFHIPDSC